MTPTAEARFNARDTAAILGCSRTYLYYLMQQGKLHKIERPSVAKQPPLFFARDEVLSLAAQIHGHELTEDDIERLRNEAQSRQGE